MDRNSTKEEIYIAKMNEWGNDMLKVITNTLLHRISTIKALKSVIYPQHCWEGGGWVLSHTANGSENQYKKYRNQSSVLSSNYY